MPGDWLPELHNCLTLLSVQLYGFHRHPYNAITAVYTVFHPPRADHAALFAGFARVLTPGGRLLLTLATREYTGQEEFDGEMEFIGRRLPYQWF